MNRNLYVLDGREPRCAHSVLAWMKWFAAADRTLAHTLIDGIELSTVFIGIDHEFSPHGVRYHAQPMLFETAIFMTSRVVRAVRYPYPPENPRY